jgi:hypothetical protein
MASRATSTRIFLFVFQLGHELAKKLRRDIGALNTRDLGMGNEAIESSISASE